MNIKEISRSKDNRTAMIVVHTTDFDGKIVSQTHHVRIERDGATYTFQRPDSQQVEVIVIGGAQ